MMARSGGVLASCGGNSIRLWGLEGSLIHTSTGDASSSSPLLELSSSSTTPGVLSFSSLHGGMQSKNEGVETIAVSWSSDGVLGGVWSDGSLSLAPPQKVKSGGGKREGGSGRRGGARLLWTGGRNVPYKKGEYGRYTCLSFTKNGKYLCGGTDEGYVALWDAQAISFKEPRILRHLLKSALSCVTFSPRRPFVVAAADEDGRLALFNLQTRNFLAKYCTSQGITSVAFRQTGPPDIVLGTDAGSITVLREDSHSSSSSSSNLSTLYYMEDAHRAPASETTFMSSSSGSSNTSPLIVSVGLDSRLVLLDVRTPPSSKCALEIEAEDPLMSLTLVEPSHHHVAVGASNGHVLLYDIRKPHTTSSRIGSAHHAPVFDLEAHGSGDNASGVVGLDFMGSSRLSASPLTRSAVPLRRSRSIRSDSKRREVERRVERRNQLDTTPETGVQGEGRGLSLSTGGITSRGGRREIKEREKKEKGGGDGSKVQSRRLVQLHAEEGGRKSSSSLLPSVVSPLSSSVRKVGLRAKTETNITTEHITKTPYSSLARLKPTTTYMNKIVGTSGVEEEREGGIQLPSPKIGGKIMPTTTRITSPLSISDQEYKQKEKDKDISREVVIKGGTRYKDEMRIGHGDMNKNRDIDMYRDMDIDNTIKYDILDGKDSSGDDVDKYDGKGDICDKVQGGNDTTTLPQYQMKYLKNILGATLEDFRVDIHEDVQNLHLELLRQFHIQQTMITNVLRENNETNLRLVKEIERLREENQRLRARQL